MNHDEYVREGHLRYEEFARTVAAILHAAIDDSGQDFHLQRISFRPKSKSSLHRKLAERGLSDSQSIETELKDLAGCRLVFYTNTDIDRFLNSRLIFENFKVDFDGSKIHHAVGSDRPPEDLYFAIHYLVSLTDERLALPEYRKFRGLRCEIQIQTILNHAWAETTHDILYHRPDIKGFGTKQFAAIKERLTKIMNKYLLPAGYEFQTVQHDFERLQQGKELFDRNTIEALKTADNNNDRYEHLRRVKNDLLPFYDDVPAITPEVMRAVVAAIKGAQNTPVKEIETPLGNMPGHTAERITDAGLEIIEELRYVGVQETFRVLCDLYVSASTDEQRGRIIKTVERLAHNNLSIWQQAGCAVQKMLQEAISTLNDADRAAVRPVVLKVAEEILNPEVTGSTWHFQSVSLHRGAVQPSEELSAIRSRVIDLLLRMYDEAKTEGEKRETLHALHQAMQLPGNARYGDAITVMVLDNTLRILQFFADRAETEQFEILQTVEHHYLWLYRRTKGLAGAQGQSHPEIAEKAKAVMAAVERFRNRANARDEFVRFKTLVGYQSVFPLQWNSDAMDIQGAAAYRAERITEYAASVTSNTAEEWYQRIRRYASVKSNDMAMFRSFGEFLVQLSKRSPEIVFGYIDKGDDVLTPFLPAVLQGLNESNQATAALKLMERWIEQGQHLAAIARHLRLIKGAPEALMRKTGQKALDAKDVIAVIEVIAAIVANKAFDLVDPVFMPGLRLLTEQNDTRWVSAIWFMPELSEFLTHLSEPQSETVLENLVLCARIDHDEEYILTAIAGSYPRSVWSFFKARLDRAATKERDGERYEDIPFQLHELVQPLSQDPSFAVDTVRSWYAADQSLFQYRGGKLLHNVFPGFSSALGAKLVAVVQEGTDAAINFVLTILQTYQGQPALHEVCKEVVDKLPENDSRLNEVEVILESTGVISGQFGFVEAYQRKKDEVSPWLSDARPKVRAFAERYQRTLDRSIAAEQRRSETDYELRRREWPEEE
jgi:ppGpp synthetase/RelA/SpoT-type nucleotidyltranferase